MTALRTHTYPVMFICSFPPPYTGQTLATQLAFDTLSEITEVRRVSISDPDNRTRSFVGLPLLYATRLIGRLVVAAYRLRREKSIVYMVPSPSRLGQLRDLTLLLLLMATKPARIVAHVHNADFSAIFARRFIGRLSLRLFRKVDAVIALSPLLARDLDAVLPTVPINIVRNTVDTALRFTNEEALERIRGRASRSAFCILFIGKLLPSKGFLDILLAIASLRSRGDEGFRFRLIGEWPSDTARLDFERQVAASGLSSLVEDCGVVSDRREMRRLLEGADVVALPTSYPHEAQPLVLIEAMNAGIPVIATAHAGIPEFVEDDVNGYLVPKHDPEAIVSALKAMEHFPQWQNLAMNARMTYEQMFQPDTNAHALMCAVLGSTSRAFPPGTLPETRKL